MGCVRRWQAKKAREEERQRERERRQAERSARRSSAFRTRSREDGKTDILFNSPGDGAAHGHVVQRESDDGNISYDYVRDEDGNVYIDE